MLDHSVKGNRYWCIAVLNNHFQMKQYSGTDSYGFELKKCTSVNKSFWHFPTTVHFSTIQFSWTSDNGIKIHESGLTQFTHQAADRQSTYWRKLPEKTICIIISHLNKGLSLTVILSWQIFYTVKKKITQTFLSEQVLKKKSLVILHVSQFFL